MKTLVYWLGIILFGISIFSIRGWISENFVVYYSMFYGLIQFYMYSKEDL
jgi:hypothetical protein